MKIYMFPGQGSQSRGMGGALFDEFEELVAKADKILGYSIKELCHDDPRGELSQTQFTQPALYVVNALSYFSKLKESNSKPDFLLGHSLGEFNALLAAECFDFEAGLKLVSKRGELMSQATDGAMAAILNGSEQKIRDVLEQNELTEIDLANFNAPSQIVISGSKEQIGKAQSPLQDAGMIFYPLNTSGAFHSRLMQPAKEKFSAYLKKFKLSKLKIPVVSNVTARAYQNEDIVSTLSDQMTNAVRWSESIQYLMELGNGSAESRVFEEVGHGDVLTKLVDKIKRETAKSSDGTETVDETSAGRPSPAGPDIASESQPLGDEDEARGPTRAVEEKVDSWNRNHPVGTKVKSLVMDYGDLETRTEAVVLFGHRAAVYMKGYNGYFDLDELEPLNG